MDPIDEWFNREVLQWRAGAAIAWSLITMPVVCVFYVFFSSICLLQPLTWFTDFAQTVISLSFLSTLLMILLVNGMFFVYSKKTFTVVPTLSVTRLSHMRQLCNGSRLLYACICTVTGLILGWLCTCLLEDRYQSLSYRCSEDSQLFCIREHHLFLVFYGGYTGLMYMLFHFVMQNNLLQFPAIQQAKFFQVRSKVIGTTWNALKYVIWQIKFYYLFYYLFGQLLRDWIVDILSLQFGPDVRLDNLYGLLLDFGLLWQTLLLGFFIQFSWSFGVLLYRIYSTEHYEFSVSTMFENFRNKCLVNAMSCDKQPLIKALGFMDLNILSKHSYTRRKELFSLSQPGGHPHNWNKILAVCLSVINELSCTVQETNWKILANAPVRQSNLDKPVHFVANVLNGHTQNSLAGGEGLKPKTSSLKDKLFEWFKKRICLKMLTADVPDIRHKNLFVTAFIQIWAVEALSALVAASYKEDPYGIVQMSLSDIITAIINLQENVDKHFKLTGGVNRRSQKDVLSNEMSLKCQLQSSLQTSIYMIVNTFGKHLLEVELPLDIEKKIHNFLEFKE